MAEHAARVHILPGLLHLATLSVPTALQVPPGGCSALLSARVPDEAAELDDADATQLVSLTAQFV